MSRRAKTIGARSIDPDPVYGDVEVASFVNFMTRDGKRSLSQRIFYEAMSIIREKASKEGIEIFKKALEQIKPPLEVRSRRVGGVTYQIPREVRPERKKTLAIRWLVNNARSRKEKGMAAKLAAELMDAANGQGGAFKKRSDTRRMADANKAFSHYRW